MGRIAASVAAFVVATGAWAQSDRSDVKQTSDDVAQKTRKAGRDVKQGADDAADKTKKAADDKADQAKQAADDVAQKTKESGPELKKGGENLGKDLGKDTREITRALPAAGDNSPAAQAPVGTTPWSMVSAQTIGEGKDLVAGEVGFPGITATYLHGVSNSFDVGAKLGFLYGSEGADPNLGFRAQAAMRWLIYSQNNMKMGVEVEPGLYQTFIGPVAGGIVLPVKYTVAFAVTDSLYLHAGVDIPMMLGFGRLGTGFSAPILFGGGAEYFITDAISITAKVRVGPSFDAGAYFLDQDLYGNRGQVVRLGFNAAVGAAFRL